MTQHFCGSILNNRWYKIYVHSLNISRTNGRTHQVHTHRHINYRRFFEYTRVEYAPDYEYIWVPNMIVHNIK